LGGCRPLIALSDRGHRHIETCARRGDPIASADTREYCEEIAGLGEIGKYPKDRAERRDLEIRRGDFVLARALLPLRGEHLVMIIDGGKRTSSPSS
jgi:hypothetical protein